MFWKPTKKASCQQKYTRGQNKNGFTAIEGSRIFYSNAGSEDKAFKTYEGYYHELVNEPGRQVFMDDVLSWIKERI